MRPYLLSVVLLAFSFDPLLAQPESKPALAGVAKIQADAKRVESIAKSPLLREFLAATQYLPHPSTRTLWIDPGKRSYLTKAEYEALSDEERGKIRVTPREEDFYYNTKYGSPLAYGRAIEILADAGLKDWKHKRVLDYGYGTVGHLRLMALCGAEAVGVDVDPMLPALYNDPSDQGKIKSPSAGMGDIKMVNGSWPGDDATRKAVGDGFDVFTSKNTLKRGYIHPEQEVDPRMLVQLGVDDAAYVKAIFDVLKPGGIALIYNICPKRTAPGPDYKPWSDGRCPFPREMLEAAGFEILEYDRDDNGPMGAYSRGLGWDEPPYNMHFGDDTYAEYTLLRRK